MCSLPQLFVAMEDLAAGFARGIMHVPIDHPLGVSSGWRKSKAPPAGGSDGSCPTEGSELASSNARGDDDLRAHETTLASCERDEAVSFLLCRKSCSEPRVTSARRWLRWPERESKGSGEGEEIQALLQPSTGRLT